MANQAGMQWPTNAMKLTAFLRFVARMENPVFDDGAIESNYNCLKKSALQVRKELEEKYPRFRDSSWKKVDEAVRKTYTLLLEKRVVDKYRLPLDRCVDSWAADRLMFESFRGAGKSPSHKRQRTNEGNEGGSQSRYVLQLKEKQCC